MAGTYPRRVVIVGAALAGLRTAEELRAAGFDGNVTLVGKENHLPYDRPPLSKQLLSGKRMPDDVTLRGRVAIEALDIDLRLGCSATAIEDERIVLDGSERLPYSDLVIATGVSARRMPDQPATACVHVLRTLEDSIRLRDQLERSSSLLVVGAGFIGAEVAAVARMKGLDVTMVEALPSPFARALGTVVGARCARLHEDQGVRIVANARISEISASETSGILRLADGTVLEADCILVGIGTVPNTDWLPRDVLDRNGGIPCDEAGRVEGRPHLFAVGDVAAWQSKTYGDRRRVEHWTNAGEQAHAVARSVLNEPLLENSHDLPYFWSDQYRTKLQLVGRPDLANRVELVDLPDKPGRVVGMYFRSSRLVAAVTFGAPAVLARYRPLVASMADEEAVRAITTELVSTRV